MSEGPSHASSFDENDYSRPNQPWQCGWAAEGHACPLGPTKWGLCRSAHECTPYKNGDTWFCARTKAHGGTCDEGPLPDGTCCKQIQKCQPTRSVLSRRGVVSFTVFASAIALAFIILGSPNRQNLVSPGDLTSQHSQVIDRCEDCHAAAAGGLSDWTHASFDATVTQRQSDLCLQCHAELGPNAKQPHGRNPELLVELTRQQVERLTSERQRTDGELVVAKTMLPQSHDALSCATCHREHRGNNADLTRLTNQQCQVCHVDAFHSFSDGHPEFTTYPHERRTRLYFDHVSHFGKHFAVGESGRDRKCNDCHQPDVAGRYMLVKPFELTCAECHSHQIHDDTTLGIAVVAIPSLDVESLRNNAREIGQWPSEYPFHVEATGTVSPILRILLHSYEGYAAIEETLSGVDVSDLRDADSPQLLAAESLVWFIKGALYDIVQSGHPEIHRRLTTVLGTNVSAQQITMLANSYPLTMTIEMQQEWFSSLRDEVESKRSGNAFAHQTEDAPADPGLAIQVERRESDIVASGWYLHGSSLSLRYRANGHADPLLKTLLDVGSVGIGNRSDALSPQETLHALFDQVASPFSAGRCTKCHSVERGQDGRAHVNWLAYRRPLSEHRFTGFSHAPHVTLLREEACAECHSFNKAPGDVASLFRPEFVTSNWLPATNPHDFTSDFEPMSRASCAKCHSNDSGRDRCLTCHNYHVR